MRRTADGTPREVRFRRITADDLPGYVEVLRGSYPLFFTDRDAVVQRFGSVLKTGYPQLIAGQDSDDRVAGTYAFYTFVATILGRGIPAAGLGLVATALHRKKQRVALQIMKDFVRRARRAGCPISFLYPFRRSFYADMGWGAICEMKQYRVAPDSLPLYPERCCVSPEVEPDWTVLDRIHREAVGARGALGLSRPAPRWDWLLRSASHVFLAGPPARPEGYMLLSMKRVSEYPHDFHHDLEVQEMEWTTPGAMRALLGFLSSQRDQVREIHLLWPREGNLDAILREQVRPGTPSIHHALDQGAIVGLGAMLRLEDPEEAFRIRPYAGDEAISLDVRTVDPLSGRKIRFRSVIRGEEAAGVRPRRATLTAGLPALSRLWAGALGFGEAAGFGLAEITPASAAGSLDRLFAAPSPWVTERF